MATPLTTSKLLSFGEYETWYQVTGDLSSGRTPLVALHGGPGVAHNYLKPMEELAQDGWPLVLYDQLGCGLSTHLPNAPRHFWTIELFGPPGIDVGRFRHSRPGLARVAGRV